MHCAQLTAPTLRPALPGNISAYQTTVKSTEAYEWRGMKGKLQKERCVHKPHFLELQAVFEGPGKGGEILREAASKTESHRDGEKKTHKQNWSYDLPSAFICLGKNPS